LDVIKTADWIIDLGPEGGERGGIVVAEGTPEEVAQIEDSYTGQFLCRMLLQKPESALTKKAEEKRPVVEAVTSARSDLHPAG